MRRATPPIHPAAIGQRTLRGVFESVRTQAQVEILGGDRKISAIDTVRNAPSNIEPMKRG
jgi:hypothetical protein